MRKCLFLFFAMVLAGSLSAQLQDRIWIFGRPYSGSTNATLYFGNLANPLTALPGGQPSHITTNNGAENRAVATNPTTGALIFYTDGVNVFDKFHNLVDIDPATPGYESLGANASSCQPVALSLCPGAGGSSFYIFSNSTGATASTMDIGPITYRLYNTITDVFGPVQSLPGPYGTGTVTEGMKIIPSETNPDILWLITSIYSSSGTGQNRYVIYKIDQSVVSYQGFCDMGPLKYPLPGSGAAIIVDFTYTEANTALGVSKVGFCTQYTSSVNVCDFDNTNGQFLTGTLKSYVTQYANIPSVYNVEFSPNGQFLYYTAYYTTMTTNDLYQINLQNTPLTSVFVHQFNARYAGGLKLGPDGLIYHIADCGLFSDTSHVGRILLPNVAYVPGVTVFNQFYQENFQKYPHIDATSFCEYLYLPAVAAGIADNATDLTNVSLYPNLASATLYFGGQAKQSTAEVYDISGKLLLTQPLKSDQMDITGLVKGLYFIKISSAEGSVIKKFVKE